MENNPQFRPKFHNLENYTEKKTFHQNLEEHSLSLRKKKNIRQRTYELPPEFLSDLYYKINTLEIEQKICNDQLYIQYKNSNDEKNSLGFLFQMLLSGNDDIIKFSVAKIRDFLVNIEEKKFHEKNYDDEFSDKLIKFLFDLMFNKSNDLLLLSNISFLLNKLAIFIKNQKDLTNFFNIYFNYFDNLLSLAKSISNNEPKIKNMLYMLTDKIFFIASEDMIMQLEKFYPNYITQIHSELKNLDESKFVKNMPLISTLLQSINNCFYYQIYTDYFFSYPDNNTNELNAENIIKFIQKLLKFSYQNVLFEQEIRCIQNFIYLFMDNEKLFKDKNLKNKVRELIHDLEFEKIIVPMIYDNTVNNEALRLVAIQMLINAMYICHKDFCEVLIDNDITVQIIKLENYLISQTQFKNKNKELYSSLLDLIYNLIENESAYIIGKLSRDNNCISLLFKLQKIPFYGKENKIIKIFNVLISSNHKYIPTLLISEGICELYKNILENEPNSDDVATIINNLISMVNYTNNFVTEKSEGKDGVNLVLMHLEKIGFYEVLNNLKSRNDLSDDSISAINEISSLFNHN